MSEYITSSVTPISPSQLFNDGFELSDQSIIPSSDFTGSFTQGENLVEFHIYDANVNHLYANYNFTDWSTSNENAPSSVAEDISTIVLDPSNDVFKQGYQNGTLYAIYNFINLELNSSQTNKYFISEISSDRTEIALQSNFINSSETIQAFSSLKEKLDNADYFDEFYLSLGKNNYIIGINIDVVDNEEEVSIIVKLYEPLPSEYDLQSQVYVATKVGETQAYQVGFVEDFSSLLNQATYIKGPNINIELQDLVNNSTELKSKSELLDTDSSQSLDKLTEVLNKKGVTITPNYSYNTFNEFVNFSSAKERINNFVEKVASIQAYEADIENLAATTASNPNVSEISSSIASLETNIQNIIKNFDGFESYQYYTEESNTGGFTYPKTGSAYPYTLLDTTSTNVLEWLGSDVESNQYYGGYRLSASLYDESNQNWLYYTIPDFIKENSNNNNYITFANMVGQHFDEIWLYTKALSERFNTTNDPDSGLPLELAEEAIKSLGFSSFGNNYNNQDNFIGLTGEDNGSYVPPTGSELITQYIAVNNGEVINYWNLAYSYLNYVEQQNDPGFPYAIDKVSKEIFKRLYHNMAYLTKKKGTISGLRQLINIWGIPNTILRINEFGGKNKDNSDDYDLWYNRYSHAFHPVSTQHLASASVKIPWMPLERNRIADGEYIVPDGFAFRFKTTGIPSSSFGGTFYTQSLISKKSNGVNDDNMDFAVQLQYLPPTTASYSGSADPDDIYNGRIRFYLSGSDATGRSTVLEGPYFDGGWWSVLVQRDQHVSTSLSSSKTVYEIFVKNKQYNGYDGNYIGFETSGSLVKDGLNADSASFNASWNSYGSSSHDGLYVGGYISGSTIGENLVGEQGKIFSGSLQEFRYYSHDIAETVFNDFVMDPESIEGNNITGSESSFDIVNFRAPLGNEMEFLFTSSQSGSYTEAISSSHPAITGSATSIITASFVNPVDNSLTSSYDFINYENITTRNFSKPNREVYFLDQPAVGIRNRISNKIQIEDGDQYGTILSRQVSIDQNYQISRSYTEDITSLEVAFSPQDEINDDIIHSFGYGVVSDALADPRHLSSSDDYYPRLRSIAEDYFKKYTKGNIYDYLRLIKYYDNSLFKSIKSYVPARTSVTTGVVIKQHLLERNRRPPVKLDPTTKVAVNSSSSFNNNIELGNLEISTSLPIGTFSGGPGGVVDDFNIPQMVTASLVSLTSSAVINVGGTYNPFDGGSYTITDNVDGLFTFEGNAGIGYNQTRLSEEYPTFFEEDVPLIFIVSMIGNINDFDGVFRLKRDGTTLEEFAHQQNSNLAFTEVRFSPVFEKSGSIFTFEIDYAGGSTAFQSFKLGVFASYVNSNDDTTFKGPGVYSNLTPTTGDRVPRGNYVYETNRFNLRQGYINNVSTISGSQEIAEIHEREFYDGEFSGSEFVATSQSLFYNPYKEQTLLDTRYDVTKERFIHYENLVGSSFPSPKVRIYWNESVGSPPSPPDDVLRNITWSANEVMRLYLGKTTNSPDIFHVQAIAFRKQGAATTFDGVLWPDFGDDIGIYPVTSSEMNEGNGGSWGWPEGDRNIPNFTFKIDTSQLTQGSISGNDPLAFNLPYANIVSVGLSFGRKGPITTFDSTATSYNYEAGSWIKFDNLGVNGGGRTIQGSGDPQFGVAGWDSGGVIYTLPSKADLKYQSYLENYNLADNDVLAAGDVGISYWGLSYLYTGSADGNYSASIPLSIAFHYEDKNGNNNSNTVKNPNLDFKFIDLTNISSRPTWTTMELNRDQLGNHYYLVDNFQNKTVVHHYLGNGTTQFYSKQYANFHKTAQNNKLIILNPILPSDFNFDTSIYNPLFNNVSESRANSKIQKVDYTRGIQTPTNEEAIISGSAEKAETPDSNYTQKSRIIPRYLGSELSSADYNIFTPAGGVTASNGDIITWGGDTSYGNTAVIDKHPIYFARFNKSYHNPQLENTFTFELDSLIISPFEDIAGTEPTANTIKIDGSNNNLTTVSSTFEINRNATINYDKTQVVGTNRNKVDLSQLAVGSSQIYQGAAEYQTLGASTTFIYGNNPEAVYPNSLDELYFSTASWIIGASYSAEAPSGVTLPGATASAGDIPVVEPNSSGFSSFLATSSNAGGSLILAGGGWRVDAPFIPENSPQAVKYFGPGLGLLHSINVQVSKSIETTNTRLGVPNLIGPVDPKNTDPSLRTNYFVFNYSSSNLNDYLDNQLPFIIKKGDEIRCSYNLSQAAKGVNPAFKNVTFTVKRVIGQYGGSGSLTEYSMSSYLGDTPIQSGLHNVLVVTPDPTTLEIPRGEINSFTIRRRTEADDRVIIYQTPPLNARGIQEATEGGFIIPSDFTATQKSNALTIINQLREKSAFIDDVNRSDT